MDQVGDVLTGLKNQDELNQFNINAEIATAHYNPKQSPPDWEMAKQHGQAKRVCQYNHLDRFAQIDVKHCPCCGLAIGGKNIPLKDGIDSIYHLGSGYPLYFTFTRCAIILLLAIFLSSGLFNLISNEAGNGCASDSQGVDDNYCGSDFILDQTIANKRNSEKNLEVQLILNFFTVIVIMFLFHYVRYRLRYIKIHADDITVTPADFTIKLGGVPITTKASEIKDWIESFSDPEDPVRVHRITRSYGMREFIKLVTYRERFVAKKKQRWHREEKKRKIQAKIDYYEEQIQKIKTKGMQFHTSVFVSFERAQHADAILKRYEETLKKEKCCLFFTRNGESDLTIDGNHIKFKRAAEPSDIIWENTGFDKVEKRKRKFKTKLIAIATVTACFGLLILISFIQGKVIESQGKKSKIVQVISILASILISVLNFVLGQVIRKLALYEKHGTYTGYFVGIAEKLAVAQTVNTALTTLAAKIVLTADFSKGIENILMEVNVYGTGGIVESMFYVFVTNAFMGPLMNLIDPFYWITALKRWWVVRKKDSKMTQKDAHILFEGTDIDLSFKYSLMIKTTLLTTFYAPIMPTCILFGMGGLFFSYWVDKIILLRRASLPLALGSELSDDMTEYLEWMAFLFSLGNLVGVLSLERQQNVFAFGDSKFLWVAATFIASLIHIFLPMAEINERLFPIVDEVTEHQNFHEATQEFFATEYDVENPVTRKMGLKRFMNIKKEFKEESIRIMNGEDAPMPDWGDWEETTDNNQNTENPDNTENPENNENAVNVENVENTVNPVEESTTMCGPDDTTLNTPVVDEETLQKIAAKRQMDEEEELTIRNEELFDIIENYAKSIAKDIVKGKRQQD